MLEKAGAGIAIVKIINSSLMIIEVTIEAVEKTFNHIAPGMSIESFIGNHAVHARKDLWMTWVRTKGVAGAFYLLSSLLV